jgi:hypothetical protein
LPPFWDLIWVFDYVWLAPQRWTNGLFVFFSVLIYEERAYGVNGVV